MLRLSLWVLMKTHHFVQVFFKFNFEIHPNGWKLCNYTSYWFVGEVTGNKHLTETYEKQQTTAIYNLKTRYQQSLFPLLHSISPLYVCCKLFSNFFVLSASSDSSSQELFLSNPECSVHVIYPSVRSHHIRERGRQQANRDPQLLVCSHF